MQIAEHLGVGRTTVYRWLNRDKVAGYEQRRRQAKEQWHRTHYRGVCATCGGATSARDQDRCLDCRFKAERERHQARLEAIETLYNAGIPLRKIAVRLGHTPTPGALGREMAELRAQGRIGYRLPRDRVDRMRNGRWGKVA